MSAKGRRISRTVPVRGKRREKKPARTGRAETELPPELPHDTPAVEYPIVGIGASAGGLEAVSELLRFLPRDTGMAFVLVQHLAPTHDSMLSEILSAGTEMPVSEARDGTRIEPDHLYVIPPNANLAISQGFLRLLPRSGTQNMPIDLFFRSLADEQKGKAIGVILSGTASDGALGMKAIKAAGGITLAQDPLTAKYDGMPRSSIAAGAVDFVLSAEGIATEIAKIGQHPYVARPMIAAEDQPKGEDRLGRIFLLLRQVSGVDFTYYKHATIKRRINRRMALLKIERLPDYIVFLQQNRAEVEALYQDILIHVTGFFRDAAAFDALKSEVFPKILERRSGDGPVRIWVPGCSTGEEAYTIAITLLEVLDARGGEVPVQIFATDISPGAIEKARAGVYPDNVVAELSPERVRRHFRRAEGGYQISRTIRDMCIFAKQDVTRDPPFSNMDLISCRNVMIYLGPILQKRIMSNFHYALKPMGYLLLGTSETVGSFVELFGAADKKNRIFAKKSVMVRPALDFHAEYPTARADGGKPEPLARQRGGFQAEVNRQILDALAPAAIVVDSAMQIVQFRGETGRYLEPVSGEASLGLMKMAKPGLGLELRRALQSATRKKRPVRAEGVRFKNDGRMGKVSVEVVPIELGASDGEPHFLILFEEAAVVSRGPAKPRAGRIPKAGLPARMRKLEDELSATREYLQSIIQDMEAANEELQSANEEILSSNEELQSTNEELETAKEELQSTNEELNTVNEELQTRNEELSRVNSDVLNLLASVHIPIVMVGNDLRIRRFTPMAAKAFNLIPTDVGRPIGDIKSNLNLTNLSQALVETIDTVSVREIEVQDAQGHWYSMRIRPYKTVENKIDGAVLSLVDVDVLKRRGDEQIDAETLETIRHPFVLLDGELRVKHANRMFYDAFGLTREAATDAVFLRLQDGLWETEAWKELFEDVLPKAGRVRNHVIEQEDGDGKRRRLHVSAALIPRTGPRRTVLLGIEEIDMEATVSRG